MHDDPIINDKIRQLENRVSFLEQQIEDLKIKQKSNLRKDTSIFKKSPYDLNNSPIKKIIKK